MSDPFCTDCDGTGIIRNLSDDAQNSDDDYENYEGSSCPTCNNDSELSNPGDEVF